MIAPLSAVNVIDPLASIAEPVIMVIDAPSAMTAPAEETPSNDRAIESGAPRLLMSVLGSSMVNAWLEAKASITTALATLLTGGTPLVAGLATASDAISSRLVRGTVAQATQMVREGESLHGALASKGIMPVLALDMIEVGESSGALAPMLTSVAEFYEDEVNLRLGALVSLIEPVMLIFMGLLVAFILISLYLPIFSLSTTGISGS